MTPGQFAKVVNIIYDYIENQDVAEQIATEIKQQLDGDET